MKFAKFQTEKAQAGLREFKFRPPAFGVQLAVLALCGGLLLGTTASSTTAGLNPYSGIVERNTFGLKPPVNADLIKPPPPVVADIKIEGFSTILGRKQVMLNVKVPAKPPEPARNQSLVFVEGQREGEVEVKEIDPAEGTVKVDNGGTLLALNMKDHGQKPTPGAAVPAAPGLPPGSLPGGVPPPAASAVPTASVPAAPTTPIDGFGGNKTIPARALRTGVEGGVSPLGATTTPATPSAASQRSVEENIAIYEVNRAKNEALINAGAKIPRMPIHSLLKQSQPQQPTPSP